MDSMLTQGSAMGVRLAHNVWLEREIVLRAGIKLFPLLEEGESVRPRLWLLYYKLAPYKGRSFLEAAGW